MKVRPKKSLGQHFLRNAAISQRIAQSLTGHGRYGLVLEIGPGMGALTSHLLKLPWSLRVVEVDDESVQFLRQHFPQLAPHVIPQDILKLEPSDYFGHAPFAIAGNFPYNISSQILFRVLDWRQQVPEVVGMFQREVARRIASGPGSRDYGILSVLLQAFYKVEYLFTVDENEFDPPPKVKSGVVRLQRNEIQNLPCDETFFFRVVKTAFNQRRKTLRNSLRALTKPETDLSDAIWQQRPEQLSVEQFVHLTSLLS